MLAAAASACKSVPRRELAVASLDVVGTHAVSRGEIEERIATVETPKVLGLVRSPWVRYEPYDPSVLAKDLERIEHLYRRHGFYEAEVRAARVEVQGSFADVEIVVREGPRVSVGSVAVDGLESLPPRAATAVRAAVTLVPGEPFDEDKLGASTEAIKATLARHGRALVQVEPRAVVDLARHRADVRLAVDPGPRCTVGPIVFEGLGSLPEAVIRRAFVVRSGDTWDADELEAGRRAILDLGVLASAEVQPDLSDPTRTAIPVRVRVMRSSTAGFKLGGGFQIDFLRFDVHALVGWEHRNFLGGMRRISFEEQPSLVLYPTALPRLDVPHRFLPGHRFSLGFRQPGFLEARTVGTLRLEQSIYPVIVPPPDPDVSILLGYRELRGTVGPERTFSLLHLSVATLYGVQASWPFTYVGPLDPDLRRVLVSYVNLAASLDLRDDPIQPHAGFLLSGDLQLAGGVLRGDASDVRVRPEMRMYLPAGRKVTLATRAMLGMLFPRSYGATLESRVPSVRDLQLLWFRGFFSGGADSNRGYGYRDVGPHGPAPFYVPGSVAAAQERCREGSPEYDARICQVGLGGLTSWEASMELRFPVHGDFGAVLFVDASDVARERLQVRLDYPHLSTGFGVRYLTPVGPVRLDLGFRVPGAQRIGGELDPRTEGRPGTLYGVPVAIALGIGEAF